VSETLPTNQSVVEVLRKGAVYLPRMHSPEQLREFHAIGDVIQVNEGDFWTLLMYSQIAADRLELLDQKLKEITSKTTI
jgi:hypothetical protein